MAERKGVVRFFPSTGTTVIYWSDGGLSVRNSENGEWFVRTGDNTYGKGARNHPAVCESILNRAKKRDDTSSF